MISTKEALALIEKNTSKLLPEKVNLEDSLGLIMSTSPIAEINLPPFSQSAMDGYALKFGEDNTYIRIGEIKAGDDASTTNLMSGEAIKIFTGAMVPQNADAVCRIEDIVEKENHIEVLITPPTGANIRPIGEQVTKGSNCFDVGKIINEASIGYLANLGITSIEVTPQPKIQIISTGNELVVPEENKPLSPGKIYESNGIMLHSSIRRFGFTSSKRKHIIDDYNSIVNGFNEALNNNDVLIISGGISVGDYDFVEEALLQIGVEKVFYKVNQKPGKPLFFGKTGNKLVFALPGNPAAALTCFYLYVLPSLRKMSGHGFLELPRLKGRINVELSKPNSREQFLKAIYSNGDFQILDGQSSAMLRTYADANTLVHLPANTNFEKGATVEAILIG